MSNLLGPEARDATSGLFPARPSTRGCTRRAAAFTGLRFRCFTSACILALIGSLLPFTAQASPPATAISLPAQVELPRLLDLCAARLGLALDYDSAALRGQITLRADATFSPQELWTLTNQLLVSRGFTTVGAASGTGLSVVKLQDAASVAKIEPGVFEYWAEDRERAGASTTEPGFLNRLVRIRHTSAKSAADSLRPLLFKPGGAVALVGDSQVLLIGELSARWPTLISMLQEIDGQRPASVVREYQPRTLTAQQLAATAAPLAAKMGTSLSGEVSPSPNGAVVLIIAPEEHVPRWESLLSGVDRAEAEDMRVYNPGAFALSEVATLLNNAVGDAAPGSKGDQSSAWRLVEDPLTNTLLLTTTPAKHARVETLLARLADRPAGAARPMRAFPVRNRPVGELLSTLQSLISSGALDAQQSSLAATGPDRDAIRAAASPTILRQQSDGMTSGVRAVSENPGQQTRQGDSAAGQTTSPLSITVDESTSTIIAVGEPRHLAQLADLIRTLDVRQPQVMIEVLLISLSESDAVALGVELVKLDTIGDAALRLSSLFGLGSGAGAIAAPGSGGTASIINPGEFGVLVRAVQNLNKGRSLSMPRVLVNNNQAAKFSSTLQQPFATSNATNSSTIISYGGSESAGTTISVTPQIGEGDHLVLTYALSLSSFVGSPSANGLPPPRQESSVDSVATIPDGYTVVVGGLETTTMTRGTEQVPLLGRVPLLGELFKSRSNSDSTSRFYVFIRANVMRHQHLEDLRYTSDRALHQADLPPAWPVTEPRVIR